MCLLEIVTELSVISLAQSLKGRIGLFDKFPHLTDAFVVIAVFKIESILSCVEFRECQVKRFMAFFYETLELSPQPAIVLFSIH